MVFVQDVQAGNRFAPFKPSEYFERFERNCWHSKISLTRIPFLWFDDFSADRRSFLLGQKQDQGHQDVRFLAADDRCSLRDFHIL